MASILVIGGSSGIGIELSNKLADQGYNVIATYNQNTVSSQKINLTYHHMNVLDKETADYELQVAGALEFLLSEKSSWITGQVLHVDGGISKLKL